MPASTEVKSDIDLLSEGSEDVIVDKKLPEKRVISDDNKELDEDEIIPESNDNDKQEPESDDEPEQELEVKSEELTSTRPTIAQLKQKYPEIFKDFPGLRAAIYEEHEYKKIFPTVADAKDAIDNVEVLENFKEDIFNGNGSQFIEALKESDNLKPFAKNFLTNLYKTDRDAHWEVISPILQNIVQSFFNEGERSKNDNIKLSAENLAIWLFGSEDFASGKKSLPKDSPKEDESVKNERAAYKNERFNDFRIDVLEKCSVDLNSAIRISVDKQNISKTLKDLVTDKIQREIDEAIAKDPAHMRLIDSLWKKAASSNYSSDYKSRITSAYLERAKQLEPGIRRKLLGEVIGNTPEEGQRKRDIVEKVQSRREPGSEGKPSGPVQAKNIPAKNIDWNKTTDMDFLNDRVEVKQSRR